MYPAGTARRRGASAGGQLKEQRISISIAAAAFPHAPLTSPQMLFPLAVAALAAVAVRADNEVKIQTFDNSLCLGAPLQTM